MPITSILVLAAVVFMFVIFGATLAWAEYRTRDVVRRDPKIRQQVDHSLEQIGKHAGRSGAVSKGNEIIASGKTNILALAEADE